MKICIGVFFGGKSVEHEISVISALQAIESIDKDKYDIMPIYITKANEFFIGDGIDDINAYKDIPSLLKRSQRVILVNDGKRVALLKYPTKLINSIAAYIDIAFPIVHGTNVEDGTLQGYLKMNNLPMVGCDVVASAIGMDKYIMKAVLRENNVSVLDCRRYLSEVFQTNEESVVNDIESVFSYPVIVKPANLGSSIGISVARNKESLLESMSNAFLYSRTVLIERAIQNLQEVNCAVLGDEYEAEASECEEPLNGEEILSYENKYIGGGKGFKSGSSKGMVTLSRRIPANISEAERIIIRQMAVTAFKSLGCNGVVRIDFMIDRDTNEIYLNEVNTIPGSLAFYLWEPVGISYKELLSRMIELGLRRKRLDEDINYSFDTNILSNVSFGGIKGSM
jgi:D-alanine--D-alanine ligase